MINLINKLLGRTASCIRTDDELIKKLKIEESIYLDVRTESEFAKKHIKGAINIPVQVLSTRIKEVKDLNRPVIAYCRSGKRSELATTLLTAHQVECYNGGGFLDLEDLIVKTQEDISS